MRDRRLSGWSLGLHHLCLPVRFFTEWLFSRRQRGTSLAARRPRATIRVEQCEERIGSGPSGLLNVLQTATAAAVPFALVQHLRAAPDAIDVRANSSFDDRSF